MAAAGVVSEVAVVFVGAGMNEMEVEEEEEAGHEYSEC